MLARRMARVSLAAGGQACRRAVKSSRVKYFAARSRFMMATVPRHRRRQGRKSMKRHWPIVALSVVALAAIDMAYAGTKHRKYPPRYVAPASEAVVPPSSSLAPPRMYEARPGVWISTWDCITDEGYGRWRPCSDVGRGSR
jgi:hypothetical protein